MSASKAKPILSVRVSDLEKNSVWQFVNDAPDETVVRPIQRVPVSNLTCKIIGSRVRLANGNCPWALIGNLDAENATMNEHFVTLSIERNGRWFNLARYFDVDYRTRGPAALARFLALAVNEVFPISYDVSEHVRGKPAACAGTVLKTPRVRLTRAEIIAMAVP